MPNPSNKKPIEKKFMKPDTSYFSWEQRKSNISFMSVFNDETAREYIEQIRVFSKNEEGGQDICVWINSQGGYCTSLLAMIDAMNLVKNDFITVGIGQTASCGAVLLSSGRKGKRYITENARVLIHQVSGGAIGTNSEIQASANETNRMNETLFGILAKNCGKTVDELKELTKGQDLILNAQQAVEFGIVDAVLTRDVIARLNGEQIDLLGDDDEEDAGLEAQVDCKETKSNSMNGFETTSLKLEVKEIQSDDKYYYITGIASTPDIDRVYDIVKPQALMNSVNRIGKPAFIHQHNMKEMPLGVTENVYQQGELTSVVLKMPKDSHSELIKTRAEMGAYGGLSIGYIPTDFEYNAEGVRIINELDWYEVSLVTVQANPNAKILQVKSQQTQPQKQDDDNSATIENIQSVRDVEKYLVANNISKNNAIRLISVVKKLVKGEPCADSGSEEHQGEPEHENNNNEEKIGEALNVILNSLKQFNQK